MMILGCRAADSEFRHTDIVTVVRVWIYSFGVIIILALVYYLLNKITVSLSIST